MIFCRFWHAFEGQRTCGARGACSGVLWFCVVCSGSEPAVQYRLDLVIGICWLIWRSAFLVSKGLCVALGILSRARCRWDSALVVVYCLRPGRSIQSGVSPAVMPPERAVLSVV